MGRATAARKATGARKAVAAAMPPSTPLGHTAAALSERLRRLAAQIPRGSAVADIGTDHGRLPLGAVIDRDARRVVAVDLRADPLAVARRTLATAPAEVAARIELRQGDGLAPLAVDEVDAIVIAGMGAASIVAILEAHPDRVTPRVRLVLQPANEWALLRRWLADAGRTPVAEEIVWERDRPHLVIATDAGPWTWTDDDVDFGTSRAGEGYQRWLAQESARLEAIAVCSDATAAWRERVRAQWQRVSSASTPAGSTGSGAAAAARRGPRRGDR